MTVTVPMDALATEQVEIVVSVLPNSGGATYDEATVQATVAESHGGSRRTVANQRGQVNAWLRSPSPSKTRGTWTPPSVAWSWTKRQANGPPASSMTKIKPSLRFRFPHVQASMFLMVKVEGVEERDSTNIRVRVITSTTTAPKTTTATDP